MRLAWYDFSFDLPDHWEASRYSIAAPTGRFEFVDRHGALGCLTWEESRRLPDQEKILNEYHRQYLKSRDKEDVHAFKGLQMGRAGRFVTGFYREGEPCQASLHLPDCRKTLLWVLPDYSAEKMSEVWKPILESFRPNSGRTRQWSAFGVTCSLPSEFEIEKAICRPADVWFEFQRKNMHRVDLHRWGLPRELLRAGDMESFIRRVVASQEGRVLTARKSDFRGMDSVELTTEIRGTKGMDRLFSSYWKGVGRIWHNEDEKRLYAYMQAGPRKVQLLTEKELFPL